MAIRIINLRSYSLKAGEVLIKVDRSSLLGNPFYMASESKRALVCNQYEDYFNQKFIDATDTDFVECLQYIAERAKTSDVALGCWCYPKRCHAETIKSFIESNL